MLGLMFGLWLRLLRCSGQGKFGIRVINRVGGKLVLGFVCMFIFMGIRGNTIRNLNTDP